MTEPIQVTHLITGLNTGGAEMMLYKLIKGTQDQGFCHTVISLTDNGPIGERITALGVPVEAFGIQKSIRGVVNLFKLRKRLKALQGGLLQTWLYHADLVGILFARVPVIWNIQNGKLDPQKSPWTTRFIQWGCARLSAKPAAIVYCAESAQRDHEELGYQNEKSLVIENGTDMEVFHPDRQAKSALYDRLSLPSDTKIVGHFGRYDDQKNYPMMMNVFGRIAQERQDTHFVLCGLHLDPNNTELMELVATNGVADRIHLLGLRQDVDRLLPAFNVFALTSAYGEGFPNVLGEAMACGVPCVSTDVGDARRIIGRAESIAAVGDEEAFATAILDILQLPEDAWKALSQSARARITENFSLAETLQNYQSLYRSL